MRRRCVSPCAMMVAMGHLMATTVAFGHESESDRLTIVQRAPMHIALAFRVDEIAVLHHSLVSNVEPAPGRADFLLAMTAMNDTEFARLIDEARSHFMSAMQVLDQGERPLQLRNWRWSSHDQLRRQIRDLVLASIVGGDAIDHAHEVSGEDAGTMSVDAIATSPVTRIRLILPEAAGDLLVVSYRPTQQPHVARDKTPLEIRF